MYIALITHAKLMLKTHVAMKPLPPNPCSEEPEPIFLEVGVGVGVGVGSVSGLEPVRSLVHILAHSEG
jgi:hypothetical protein